MPTRPLGDASLEQLQVRLASTFRAENQAAVPAETLAELTRRKACSEVETAQEPEELPRTSEGMRSGEIPMTCVLRLGRVTGGVR